MSDLENDRMRSVVYCEEDRKWLVEVLLTYGEIYDAQAGPWADCILSWKARPFPSQGQAQLGYTRAEILRAVMALGDIVGKKQRGELKAALHRQRVRLIERKLAMMGAVSESHARIMLDGDGGEKELKRLTA